jgi:hypothetical protein
MLFEGTLDKSKNTAQEEMARVAKNSVRHFSTGHMILEIYNFV